MSASAARITAVIADEATAARRDVRALLDREHDVEVVGECESGRDTIALVRRARPDLLLLDARMPDGDGFDVLAALRGRGRPPAVVFVTAHDAYALRAFEVNAIDYLLKPLCPARFLAALDRVRAHLRRDSRAVRAPRREPRRAEIGRDRPAYAVRIPVKLRGRIRLVDAADVDYVKAEGNYVRLYAGDRSYLLREVLGSFEAKLDPACFLRIHRSTIVRLDRVQELEPMVTGEYAVTLRSGVKLAVARSHRATIRAALNIAP